MSNSFRVNVSPSVLIKKAQVNPIFQFGNFRFDFETIGGDKVNGISLTKMGMRRKDAINHVLKEYSNSTFHTVQV